MYDALELATQVHSEISQKQFEFSLLADFELALVGGGGGAASLD
jgi:hypothetical protein